MVQNLMPIVVAAIIAVALFMLVMAMTMIKKGKRNSKLEIGTNPHMKARGITCAADDARRQAHIAGGGDCADTIGCAAGCESCGAEETPPPPVTSC